jgi:hypothetical protein
MPGRSNGRIDKFVSAMRLEVAAVLGNTAQEADVEALSQLLHVSARSLSIRRSSPTPPEPQARSAVICPLSLYSMRVLE